MGRTKGDGARSKSRPSSSSLAASLSQGSGAVSAGFGGYIGSTRIDSAGPSEDAYYQNIDGESAAILRRLSKKDPITKLKALSALTAYFQEHSAAEVSPLLSCWVFEYKKLVQDNSRQVREATQRAMCSLVTTVGRSLAPHLRSVMGAWWMAHFDPFFEVSDAAKQAFQVAFPGQKKRLEALIFCASDILMNIDENLKLTPQTISEKSTPLEESLEKLELVVSSSLFSLSAMLNILFTGSPPSDSTEKIVSSAVQLFKDHKMFQGLMKSGPRVRSAVYEILRAYTQFVPRVFSSDNMDAAIKLVLGSFLEKEPGCHQAMWDMILVFSQRFGDGWAAKKIVHQRFWAFLRHGCYGSQKISFPCLLPLLSLIPPAAIAPARDFFLQLFGNLWRGLREGSWGREDGVLLLSVSKECFMWLTEHEERFSTAEGFSQGELQSFLVESVLFDIFWRGYMDEASEKSFFPAGEIGSCVVDILNLLDERLQANFLSKLREDCLSSLHTSSGQKNARMLQFFLAIAPPETRSRILNIVLKPLVARGFEHIKTTEGPEALNLLSGLVSSYGAGVFDSLACINWRGGEDSEEAEEKASQSLSEVFSSKHLQYFFRTQLLPWCTSGSNELKVQILMALLESETFSKEWEFVLAAVTESEDDDSLNTLSIIINVLQARFKRDGVEKLERWRSTRIDQKVVSIASESKLLDSSCYNITRAALEGVFYEGKHHFLLANETLLDVIKKLLRTMFLGLRLSRKGSVLLLVSSIVPWVCDQPDDFSSEASFGATKAALDLLLSCHQGLSHVEGAGEALEAFAAGFLCLRWAFIPIHEYNSDEEAEVMELGAEGEGLVRSLMKEALSTMNSLCREIPSRLQLQEKMISVVKEVLPDPEDAARWIVDIIGSTCSNEEETQKVLDLVFAATDFWPLWSAGRPKTDQVLMQKHSSFSSVVHKIGLSLGEGPLFLGSGTCSRPEVVLELLCEWKWSGGSAEEFVLPFLLDCARNEAQRGVLDKVFEALFSWAAAADPHSPASLSDPFVRGLLGVLRALFGPGGPFQREDGEKVFSSYVLNSSLPTSILPYVLEILMPALLKGSSSGIDVESSVCEWLTAALNGPSLYSSSPDDMLIMRVAVACFPLETSGGAAALLAASKADVSQTRRSLLLFLLRKHIHSPDRFGGASEPPAELLLAGLICAAVAYCWNTFGMEEWAFITGKTKEWIENGVMIAEETVEAFAEGSFEGEGSRSDLDEEILATALNVFHLMQAVRNMEEAAGTNSLSSLDECQWPAFESRVLESVLRLFLATGLTEAISSSSGDESTRDRVALRRLEQSFLWDRVADIALSSPARAREAAVRAADLWGLGKSSISALYTLLFSPHALPSLQWVSYRFLLTDPLQHQAVSCNPTSSSKAEDDEAQLDIQLESASEDIRPELLSILNIPGSVLLGSEVSSTMLGHYYLAWSIILSHIRTLETSSLVRERLLQYLKDSDIAATLLDCLVRHFPLKKALADNKKGALEASPVAEAAKRAASTGSVFFAAEGLLWSGKVTEFGAIAGALYALLLRVLPACVQTWFSGLRDRASAAATEAFTTENCSSFLLTEEFNQVQAAAVSEEYLTIKANRGLREVTALYKKEEAEMDIVIRLPSCYPLRAAEVDSTKWLGKTETRVRKWLLSMAAFLRNQNGSLYDAVLIWKKNVDREFEGVEECPICYSIIHTTHHSLPRLACKTCKHKFHGACLYKWFSSSHKSTCPLCQTPF